MVSYLSGGDPEDAVRPEAAANIIAFLVATAPHSSAVRPCQPTAPNPAASHPATPRI